MLMMRKPVTVKEVELHPDAWARFERFSAKEPGNSRLGG
jgi:hypothetical protein